MIPDLSVQDSDYDGAWKEALRRYFPEILQCYFPAVAATIDWQRPLEWSDKELSQILGQSGQRNRANWSVVSGQWSVVSGQWSVVSGQLRVKHHSIIPSFQSSSLPRRFREPHPVPGMQAD